MRSPRALQSRRRSGGFLLIQAVLGVALLTTIMIAALPWTIEQAERAVARSATMQVFTVGETAQTYRQVEGAWPDEANGCVGAIAAMIADGYMPGFLQDGGTYISAWGSAVTTTCVPTSFSVANDASEARWAQTMAAELPTAAVAGATVTSSFTLPGGGAVDESRFLFRVAVPGEAWRNQMTTNMSMGGNDITDVNVASGAQADFTTVNATTVNADTVAVGSALTLANNSTVTGGNNVAINLGNNSVIRTTTGNNARVETNSLRWGPNVAAGQYSELVRADGGIDVGGNDTNPGFANGYIDFHFNGVTENYNSRLQADANGQLTADTGVFRVTGDQLTEGNAKINGILEVADVQFADGGFNRRFSSFLNDAGIFDVASGSTTFVPSPTCPAGLSPRIFTTPVHFAQGPLSKPLAQVYARAQPVAGGWNLELQVLTEDGYTTPAPGYGKVMVILQCA